jgi:hypothetical protein
MNDLGIRVFVEVPAGSIAFEESLSRPPETFADAARNPGPPKTYALGRRIDQLASKSPVLRNPVEVERVRYLQIGTSVVSDIANAGEALVHWFELGALGYAAPERPDSPLELLPAALRFVRPRNDSTEKQIRWNLGGAITPDTSYAYTARAKQTFVEDTDADFVTIVMTPQSHPDDPYSLKATSPAVYLAYRAGKRFSPELKVRTVHPDKVAEWLASLSRRSPGSPFTKGYIVGHVVNLLDPKHRRGRGGAKQDFDRNVLRSFRAEFPDVGYLSDGLMLLIFASLWWREASRRKAAGDPEGPPTVSQLRKKLELLGFSGEGELDAVVGTITWKAQLSSRKKRTTNTCKRVEKPSIESVTPTSPP